MFSIFIGSFTLYTFHVLRVLGVIRYQYQKLLRKRD